MSFEFEMVDLVGKEQSVQRDEALSRLISAVQLREDPPRWTHVFHGKNIDVMVCLLTFPPHPLASRLGSARRSRTTQAGRPEGPRAVHFTSSAATCVLNASFNLLLILLVRII